MSIQISKFSSKLFHMARRGVVNVYDFFVFSALLISVVGVSMAYVSCTIQQVPWNIVIGILSFFAPFYIYTFNKWTDKCEDEINNPNRVVFANRYGNILYVLSLIFLVSLLVLSTIFGGILLLLVTVVPVICGILYSFPLLPKQISYRRLKEIPFVKNIVIGFSWALLYSFQPVYFTHGIPDSSTIVTFVLLFLWGIVTSVIPDIRDMPGDTKAGIKTVPVILGETRTKTFLTFVVLSLGLPTIIYCFFFLSHFTTSLVIATILYWHVCIFLLDKVSLRNYLADFFADSQCIFFAIAIFIITSVWPSILNW